MTQQSQFWVYNQENYQNYLLGDSLTSTIIVPLSKVHKTGKQPKFLLIQGQIKKKWGVCVCSGILFSL